jgi:hypothetical protein
MNFLKQISSNRIKNRLVREAYLQKIADFLEDLQKFKKFQRYFITEEDAKKKVEELKENEEPIYSDALEWWVPSGNIEEFYMATAPGNGGLSPLYAKCFMIEFMLHGCSGPVCLLGLYQSDEKGNISSMIGYKSYENTTLPEGLKKIQEEGIKGFGKFYSCYNKIFYDIDELIPIAMAEANRISETVKIENK